MSEPKSVPPRCEFEVDKLVIKLDELVSSDISIIDDTVAKIVRLIDQAGCWDDIENIGLALREALTNAITHGNVSDPGKQVRVCVALQKDCGILIVVKDVGSGFDPSQIPKSSRRPKRIQWTRKRSFPHQSAYGGHAVQF